MMAKHTTRLVKRKVEGLTVVEQRGTDAGGSFSPFTSHSYIDVYLSNIYVALFLLDVTCDECMKY